MNDGSEEASRLEPGTAQLKTCRGLSCHETCRRLRRSKQSRMGSTSDAGFDSVNDGIQICSRSGGSSPSAPRSLIGRVYCATRKHEGEGTTVHLPPSRPILSLSKRVTPTGKPVVKPGGFRSEPSRLLGRPQTRHSRKHCHPAAIKVGAAVLGRQGRYCAGIAPSRMRRDLGR